ncbi:type II secretion system protein [Caminibacter pacificus]
MRKAFTMIELIFVIVILGILAAVALPKFLGVAQQAHEANLKSFVGTLNRSVGPTVWSKAISADGTGSVAALKGKDQNLSSYVDIPKEFGTNADANLTQYCNSSSQFQAILDANESVAGKNYVVVCRDGNSSNSLKFGLLKVNSLSGVTLGSTVSGGECIAGECQ